MKTTLNEIKKHQLHSKGLKKLLASLERTQSDEDQLDLIFILESNGIKDAIWALCCFEREDYCLFLADVAESVFNFYEKEPDNSPSRKAVVTIRKHETGGVTKETLKKAVATVTTTYDAYTVADDKAAKEATVIAKAAYKAAYAEGDAEADAAATAGYDAVFDTRKKKREQLEQLFIKHFR